MELIDSHAHIDFPQFAEDREAMLERAQAAGVATILAIGTGPGPEKLDAALPYAERYEWIYTSVGIHPTSAIEATPQHFQQLEGLAKHPKVIAWGEIGLDYYHQESPREVQDAVFRQQMELSRAAKLPIIVHCREAWADCLKTLREVWAPAGLGGILHCFSGTLEQAQQGLEMGFMVSFAGNCTYPKAQGIRDVARDIPLERILIETDSPYLAPQAYRGKRNEPAYVGEVAKALANVRNLTPQETAAATSANFRNFFKIARDGVSTAAGAQES
jgi:TatD DNase family protein